MKRVALVLAAVMLFSCLVFPPADAQAFGVGDTVEVTANVNVRDGAGTTYPEITDPDYPGYAAAGTIGTVLGGPSSADGYVWWRVCCGSPSAKCYARHGTDRHTLHAAYTCRRIGVPVDIDIHRTHLLAAVTADARLAVHGQAQRTPPVKWRPDRAKRAYPAAKGAPRDRHPAQEQDKDRKLDPEQRPN